MIEFHRQLTDTEVMLASFILNCAPSLKDAFLNKAKGYFVSGNFGNDFSSFIDIDDVYEIGTKSYLTMTTGRFDNVFDICGKRSVYTTYHNPALMESYENLSFERFNFSDNFDNDIINLKSNNVVLPYNLHYQGGHNGFFVKIKPTGKWRLLEHHLPDGLYNPSDPVFESALILYKNGRATSVRFFHFVAEVDIPLSLEVLDRLDNKVPTNFYLERVDGQLVVTV